MDFLGVLSLCLFISIIHANEGGGMRRQLLSPVVDQCPNGSVVHDNSCYIVSHLLANWPDALVYCEAYAGHLVFVETAREQQFLTQHIASVGDASTDPNHYFWIGGTDALSEGEWFWAKTLKPVTYNNWKPGEPNNDPHHQSHHQDCMAMYTSGLWDDGYCETSHNFICEIELGETDVLVG